MKFQKQLSLLKTLNLPKGKYAIFGSGPMAIRGIRDAEDIDLIVTEDLWKKLCKKYDVEENAKNIAISDIEIYKDWKPVFEGMGKVISDSETIQGYPFVKLKYVIEWKKKFGREKDKEDVKRIEAFLKEKCFSC
jgi:hypothetical protein